MTSQVYTHLHVHQLHSHPPAPAPAPVPPHWFIITQPTSTCAFPDICGVFAGGALVFSLNNEDACYSQWHRHYRHRRRRRLHLTTVSFSLKQQTFLINAVALRTHQTVSAGGLWAMATRVNRTCDLVGEQSPQDCGWSRWSDAQGREKCIGE